MSSLRKDFLRQFTTGLARENQAVVIEDLEVDKMTASAAGTTDAPGNQVRQKAGLIWCVLNVDSGSFAGS